MKKLHSHHDINSPRETIWQLLIDFGNIERWWPKVDTDLYTGWERYDLWQPIVKDVTEVYLKVVSTVWT